MRYLALKPTLFLALLCSSCVASATDLISKWNFNDLVNPIGGVRPPSNANQTVYAAASGTGTLNLAGITSRGGTENPLGITNQTGTLVNADGADAVGQSLVIQGGATSDSHLVQNNGGTLTFSVSLSGYRDPTFSLAVWRTSTGFNNNLVSWSIDGSTWNPLSDIAVAVGSWTTFTYDLSGEALLTNAAAARFKITLVGAGNANQYMRFDNIQIRGTRLTPVPEPSMTALALSGMALAAGKRRRVSRTAPWQPR